MEPPQPAHGATQHPNQMPNMREYFPGRGRWPEIRNRLGIKTNNGLAGVGRLKVDNGLDGAAIESSQSIGNTPDISTQQRTIKEANLKRSSAGSKPQPKVAMSNHNASELKSETVEHASSTTKATSTDADTKKLLIAADSIPKHPHGIQILPPIPSYTIRPINQATHFKDPDALLATYGHVQHEHFQVPAHQDLNNDHSKVENPGASKQVIHDLALSRKFGSVRGLVRSETLSNRHKLGLSIIVVLAALWLVVRVTRTGPALRQWCADARLRLYRAGWRPGYMRFGQRRLYWERRERGAQARVIRVGDGFEMAPKQDLENLYWVDRRVGGESYELENGHGGTVG